MVYYEVLIVVKSKEKAESIVNNMRNVGLKAYYKYGWIVFRESPAMA